MYVYSGWTQRARFEGRVQGVVVHARKLVSESDFSGNDTTTESLSEDGAVWGKRLYWTDP